MLEWTLCFEVTQKAFFLFCVRSSRGEVGTSGLYGWPRSLPVVKLASTGTQGEPLARVSTCLQSYRRTQRKETQIQRRDGTLARRQTRYSVQLVKFFFFFFLVVCPHLTRQHGVGQPS